MVSLDGGRAGGTDHRDTESTDEQSARRRTPRGGRRTKGERRPDAGREQSSDARTDGAGVVRPDDQTPTWYDRKARRVGLSRLTYEYFERARYEDQQLRTDSDYVERDVLGFPAWPHEVVRNLAIASFFLGMILFLSATMPPHIDDPANASATPAIILPDWYLYWTFGLVKMESLNPEVAVLGGQKLIGDRTFGAVGTGAMIGILAMLPFLNKGLARRPVEEPFWAALGVGGVVFAFTLSVLSVKNLVPMDPKLLLDLTFLLPVVVGIVSYAVLKTMRQGYMYDLNRRYYRLRPPR